MVGTYPEVSLLVVGHGVGNGFLLWSEGHCQFQGGVVHGVDAFGIEQVGSVFVAGNGLQRAPGDGLLVVLNRYLEGLVVQVVDVDVVAQYQDGIRSVAVEVDGVSVPSGVKVEVSP